MPICRVNNIELYYELAGSPSAPVVVFINGIYQDTTGWANAVRDLSPKFRTLVYDCRGQGRSAKPDDGPYTPEMHARDLAELLSALHIGRAHFIGLSNGGIVLQHFARMFPRAIGRIVLADTFSHMDAVQKAMLDSWRLALETGGSGMRFLVALPWIWSAGFLARNYDTIMALREKAIETLPTYSSLHLLEGTYHHDAREWLHMIQVPTLVVAGDQDLMVQAHHARYLQQSIPGAQLVIIQGAGHAAWLEKADEFNRIMRDFLSA